MKILYLFILILSINVLYAQTADDYYNRTLEFLEIKQLDNALESINKAITLDSSDVKLFLAKATILNFLRQFEKEFSTREETIELFPDNPFVYMNRGIWYAKIKEFEFAILDFTKALEIAESEENKGVAADALLKRGQAKFDLRKFKNAYNDFMRAYQIDSCNVSVLVSLGNVCDYINKGDETFKFYLKAVQIDPLYLGAYLGVGFKYQKMGKFEEAIKYYNKIVQIEPNYAYAYSNRSYCKLKTGDLNGAKSDIKNSIKLAPTNSYAYRNRALILIEEGNFELACKDLDKAIYYKFTVMYGDEVIKLKQKYCK